MCSPEIAVLYEDDDLVAVHKPAGMLVHRSTLDKHETVFLLQELRNQLGVHIFPVHRLDKPTSGVLLFAKSAHVAQQLQASLQNEEQTKKTYLLVCRGYTPDKGVIDHPLKPLNDFKGKSRKTCLDLPAKEALTEFERIAQVELPVAIDKYPNSRYSLVSAQIKTGRKHQIRRHFKHISHPVIGCPKYGKSTHNRYFSEHLGVSRLLLHALQIEFIHPTSHLKIRIEAQPDGEFAQLLQRFGWLSKSP